MTHFSSKVHQISNDKHKERFDDFDMFRVLGDESSEETEENADECSTDSDDEKRTQSCYYIDGLDVGFSNFNEALKHVVQHLEKNLISCLKSKTIKKARIM